MVPLKRVLLFGFSLSVAAAAYGQQAGPPVPGGAQGAPNPSKSASLQAPPPEGLQAPWDISQMLTAFNGQNQKFKALFDEMHPQQWLSNGAPPAYASQFLDARSRMDDVIRAVTNLSRQTESLSVALDTYFRMESLEIVTRSLVECVQKYGERKTADQLSALIAQNFTNRQKFGQYLRELSTQREQEFKIADAEAQRCRGMISKEPPPQSGPRKSRK